MMGNSPRDPRREAMWILRQEVFDLMRALECKLKPLGFHVALGGSVLLEGFSYDDLDVMVYGHHYAEHEENVPAQAITEALTAIESVLGCPAIHCSQFVASDDACPSGAGAEDDREVYRFEKDGRRIDVFMFITHQRVRSLHTLIDVLTSENQSKSDLIQRCSNSVAEACLQFSNVAAYIQQLESNEEKLST